MNIFTNKNNNFYQDKLYTLYNTSEIYIAE